MRGTRASARQLRVLVLTPDYPPAKGGIQVLVHRLVRHATRLRSRVVTLRSEGATAFDESEPVDVRRARGLPGGRRWSNLALNARALREAIAFRPQAVLSAHIVTSPAAMAIRAALRVPVVQYLHADEVRGRPRLTAFAVRAADATVAVSGYTRSLAGGVGADRGRVRVISVGVDLPAGRPAPRADEPTLVTVARVSVPRKGHDVVLRAMPLIRARVPEVRWVVVGDGPLRPELERRAEELGVAEAVRFVGEVPDAERDAWLDGAWVFVMPSRLPPEGTGGEGFGIAYLEAGAHGLPVVAGNVGGAAEAVADGETGLLVDPSDHAAVAEAVVALLTDRAHAEALGRAGAARARRFAWPLIAEQVEDLLLEVAARRRERP